MERLNYTVILLTSKRVKRVMPGYWFDSREQAERYAEGMTIGASAATGVRHAVIMLLNGEYDNECITKDMDYKTQDIFFREYLWPKQEQEQADFWHITDEPNQLPALPNVIEIAINAIDKAE